MPQSKLANKKTNTSTQRYLDIGEIRDDVVVMKDGSLRAILLVSSINFALKSEDEQNAIIQGYISFLNSLDFPLQIIIQSRRLNIDAYLEKLKQQQREQTNELLQTQIVEYRNFIHELVTIGDIMGKRFYIAVPYAPGKTPKKGFLSQAGDVFSPAKLLRLSESSFRRYVDKLGTRVDKISAGLGSFGITAVQLNTQSLIELFYESYNIELAQSQDLPPPEQLRDQEG